MSNMRKACTGKEIGMSSQLALPLESRTESESGLRRAWARSRTRVSYDVAIRVPALVICLRNIAAAEARHRVRRAVRARLHPKNSYLPGEAVDYSAYVFSG
jgi:hypothetical protein